MHVRVRLHEHYLGTPDVTGEVRSSNSLEIKRVVSYHEGWGKI